MNKPRFEDPDLSTPAHDAIMLWLDENANVIFFDVMSDEIKKIKNRELSVIKSPLVVSDVVKKWEFRYSRSFEPTRFIDMMITVLLRPEGKQDYPTCEVALACEVKPVIRSIGELIRQLRQYESNSWRVAVVSPDDRFREIIEHQGFIFIKAPQPDYGPQGGLF